MTLSTEPQLHPIAQAILAAIEVPENAPAQAAMPSAVFATWQQRLAREFADEVELYRQLVGLWSRLQHEGLVKAAEQLLVLAKPGLATAVVANGSLTAVDNARAAERNAPQNNVGTARNAVGAAPTQRGISIRSAPK